MSEDRRLEVLRAIVQDYVSTSEPVGSKALLERHELGVSAATVRNDMAALEEEGLISAPHTSAGRIPTDAGYRMFVDHLSQLKPMSRAERSAIETFLSQAVDPDDVVDRTVRLLSSLTQQAAVMQYPSLNVARVRHIELVPMSPERMMVVLILSTGRVEQRLIEVMRDLTEDELLRTLRSKVNEISDGLTRREAAIRLRECRDAFAPADNEVATDVLGSVADLLGVEREERVALAGTGHLARSMRDFHLSLGPVLEALEEHVVLLRLMGQMSAESRDSISVRIGAENTVAGLRSTSVVSTSYGGELIGGLGVLGPTRMDYPSTMVAVRAVARYVSDILEQ
ncbi:heat-inducible transcriptional repressor HrcA [Leekyejoonella antrihumi]|uniref:Heat-inducible transcription repressor HrcA n=1 Tax=Leekyejoonella antrihumi TaxID=1660198 RepID=A0A563DUT4_9MICO|nr:heat-inducible transcriptional repressor HrcA [Leekyejoonella antrihumi]TWP34018.1 heat-inducible transcriptional repressor HrcA [Leekyejoonella antrihumi]